MKVKTGSTLVHFLQERFDWSGKKIKQALEQGACRVNGVIERFGSTKLKTGDTVSFDRKKAEVTPPPLTLPILFEDPDLLICNKPSGLVSDAKFLVHRLDKDTSGVILIAKNRKMQKALEEKFRKREVTKIYLAVVKGRVRKNEGVIENKLYKKKTYQGQSVWGSGPKGLVAITYWKCLEKRKGSSLIQCQPVTGRTHQLRVHLSEMGHPILGDLLYGRHVMFPLNVDRLLLHAYRITLTHPFINQLIEVVAPVPKALQ